MITTGAQRNILCRSWVGSVLGWWVLSSESRGQNSAVMVDEQAPPPPPPRYTRDMQWAKMKTRKKGQNRNTQVFVVSVARWLHHVKLISSVRTITHPWVSRIRLSAASTLPSVSTLWHPYKKISYHHLWTTKGKTLTPVLLPAVRQPWSLVSSSLNAQSPALDRPGVAKKMRDININKRVK